jgi:glyoxylase-like metal-dependent hydrolase (beta-lactamase superfamily II)
VELKGLAVRAGDRLWRVSGSGFPSNTYIGAAGGRGDGFLIDPGLDEAVIDEALSGLGLVPRFVFCTHGHFDHLGSAAYFQKKFGAKVFLHSADVGTMKSSNFLLMAFKLPNRIELPDLELVSDGFEMPVGGETLVYHAAAGHTPGSCLIRLGSALFTGDTLYSRGVGLSRLRGEDPVRLRASLRAAWDLFPDDTMVHPGHGDSAAFGWIKQNNLKLRRFLDDAGAAGGGAFA